jgi:L-threonylcarbamoyladenylate synthase
MHTKVGTDLVQVKKLLENDDLVAIPTETVYGLAANALSEIAVRKIFKTKNRPHHNPLIVHVASIEAVSSIVTSIPPAAQTLLNAFSPGPITLLLPRNSRIPDIVTAGLPNVAIRIPAHPLTLNLLSSLSFPLAAPSANLFGYISPTSPYHVQRQLNGLIHYILNGGDCISGIESTIVGFDEDLPVVYRLGGISIEQLHQTIGEVRIHNSTNVSAPAAPGMLGQHYSPHTPLYLVDDISAYTQQFKTTEIGIICFSQFEKNIPGGQQLILSPNADLDEAAHNLYAAMHEMDTAGFKIILVRRFPDVGIGRAMNDRLRRASVKI